MKNDLNSLSRLLAALILAVCGLASHPLHAQKDATGCKDSPFLSRFPGSFIQQCDTKADDTSQFTMGVGKPVKTVEGKKNYLIYNLPANATYPQLSRNFSTALRQGGWNNIYTSGDSKESTWQKNGTWLKIIMGGGYFHITSITLTELTQDVAATAAELGNGIDTNGHAVVPGILFDTGKAEVKDESKPALDEVAKLLGENLKLKLFVVGHTDSVGPVAANVDLSKRRAAAVIAVLVSKYHIAAARLESFGNGPFAPIASNDTDAGRTQNRRVEIVKQ